MNSRADVVKGEREGIVRAPMPGRLRSAVWAALALAAAATYFYQFFGLSTGEPFRSGIGDWIDPYYVNVVLENWYHTVRHLHGHASPPMYFPDEAARYSHGFILYAPIYIVARVFTHPFTADTLTLLVVMIGGAWCLYLLLRRMGLGPIEAFILGACFSTSPNIINGSTVVWAQRASVFLIPPILLMLLAAINMPDRRRRTRLILGGLAGLLAGLFLAQDFYTAALLELMTGLVGLSFALGHVRRIAEWMGRPVVEFLALVKSVPRAWRPGVFWLAAVALIALAALAVSIHPLERRWIFGWGYAATNPGRVLNVALYPLSWYCGRWVIALLAHAPARVRGRSMAMHALWNPWPPEQRRLVMAIAGGGLLGALVFLGIYLKPYLEFPTFPRVMILEVLHGLPPDFSGGIAATIRKAQPFADVRVFEIVLGIVLMMWAFPRSVDRRTRIHGLGFALVSLLVILMPFQFGGWSPWLSFFAWIPGMSAVRDPSRMIYLYELAAALVVALWLTRFPRWSVVRVASVLLVAGITVTPWHTSSVSYAREQSVFEHWVRSPIQIDPSCRNFFIKGASAGYMSRSGHMWSLYAVDASFIALEHDIPTLNGYSAWAPADWDFANPQEAGYLGYVDSWIVNHNLHGTCALDIEARTMKPYTVQRLR
jgi:hypothetical protein